MCARGFNASGVPQYEKAARPRGDGHTHAPALFHRFHGVLDLEHSAIGREGCARKIVLQNTERHKQNSRKVRVASRNVWWSNHFDLRAVRAPRPGPTPSSFTSASSRLGQCGAWSFPYLPFSYIFPSYVVGVHHRWKIRLLGSVKEVFKAATFFTIFRVFAVKCLF